MKNQLRITVLFATMFLFFSFFATVSAQNADEREVKSILTRINSEFSSFRKSLERELSRIRLRSDVGQKLDDDLNSMESDVENFSSRLQRKRAKAQDVSDILSDAAGIDEFINQNPLGDKVQQDWQNLRFSLDELAGQFGVSSAWNNNSAGSANSSGNVGNTDNSGNSTNSSNTNSTDDSAGWSETDSGEPVAANNPNSTNQPNDNINFPTDNRGSIANGLIGTYRIDVSQSDNAQEIIDQNVRNLRPSDERRARQELKEKLTSAETLAIDRQNQNVSLASNLAPQISLQADGRERNETMANGGSVRVKASVKGEILTISTIGSEENDYNVTFQSIDNGRALRVTKRFTANYVPQTIFVETIYNRTSDVAQLDIFDNRNTNSNDNRNTNAQTPPRTQPKRNGQYIVSDGTEMFAVLEGEINTKTAQDGDRFVLVVQSPDQFKGSRIIGSLSGTARSGRITGRSQVQFNFETIELRNGQRYDFAGFIAGIKDDRGKTVKIDNEGTAKGSNQTTQAAKRGAIGAGIGAIIGGIVGGANGAIVGATIGAGGGAGSVAIQGASDINLKNGSTFNLLASAPRNSNSNGN